MHNINLSVLKKFHWDYNMYKIQISMKNIFEYIKLSKNDSLFF